MLDLLSGIAAGRNYYNGLAREIMLFLSKFAITLCIASIVAVCSRISSLYYEATGAL